MKINTNIENHTAGMIQRQYKGTDMKNIKADSIQEKALQNVQNLTKKKTHFDAIIITQIAQSFFQKAIVLSSRLGNIVSEALTSGKIKGDELTDALTGIRSSINEVQDGFASQSVYAAQNSAAIYQYTGIQPDIPEINTEFDALNEIANGISSGRMPDLKKIDRITDSLTNKASEVDNLFNQFARSLPFTVNGLNSAASAEKSAGLAQDTVSLINKYPQAALQSQGNINFESVKNLL